MKLVVGLGNPGSEYARHRHNVGFRVVDAVADASGIPLASARFEGVWGQGVWNDREIALLQPETWMNRSGAAVEAAIASFELPLADILIVVDDVDLPVGRLRLRARGSDGGQRGLRDILQRTGPELARLRFGVGRPPFGTDTRDHVLTAFTDDEEPALQRGLTRATEAVACWAREGITPAMNRFNAPPDPETEPDSDGETGGGSW